MQFMSRIQMEGSELDAETVYTQVACLEHVVESVH